MRGRGEWVRERWRGVSERGRGEREKELRIYKPPLVLYT